MERMARVALLPCLLAAPVSCQEPSVSPTRVDLGVVRSGAVVEASVRVDWHVEDPGTEAEVDLPATMRPLGERTWVLREDNVSTEFGFGVVTGKIGRHEEKLAFRLGDRTASVDVTWVVEPVVPGGSRILIADSPFLDDSTSDPATFDAWRGLVERARLDIDYRYSRKNAGAFDAESLQRVDVVVVAESSLVRLSDAEIARLQGFVCGGGRVIVCASRFFQGTVEAANRVCEPFGLQMIDREPPPAARAELSGFEIHKHPLTAGVETISFRRLSPTRILDEKLGVPLIEVAVLGADPFVACATTKSGGEIVTFGASLWWNWLRRGADNERLWRNLLVRPPRLR